MTKRSRALSYGTCMVLVVLGAAGAIAFSGTLGQLLALVLISMGLVLATALIFYEVGLSEDREREREQAARRPKPTRATPPLNPRLARTRGRTRRLR